MSLQETRLSNEQLSPPDNWYRNAVEVAELGTFEWNMLTDNFGYTKQMAACFGLTGKENISRIEFTNAVIPEDHWVREEAHNIAFKTGKLAYDARVAWPDKSIHWLRFNGQVFFDEQHKPIRMLGTALDITEQRREESRQKQEIEEGTRFITRLNQELHKSEEKFLRMIEEVQDYAILLLDIDGTILNWNRGAEKIKGYHESEIIGKNFRIFYSRDDQEQKLPEKLINLAKSEGRAMHEGYRIRKDGSRFWGSIVITALHNKAGEVISFSKVTRDLSDKKLAEDKLKRYTEELEIRNKELEQFAYVASHDLQEPLRKIQVFTGLLKKNLDDPEQAEKFFEKITNAAQRMSDLIESILKYSRVSPSAMEIRPVDLNNILLMVKSDLEFVIEEKHAVIEYSDLPGIDAIESQIHQLFLNLLTNSLKFADKPPVITIQSSILKGEEINAEFPLVAELEYTEIIFKDNGIGFEPEEAAKIFNIFMRLNGQRFAGSGIGLALCKRIVENHHGFIKASGEPGIGATFYIYLPLKANAN